jgi:hypothetical protein
MRSLIGCALLLAALAGTACTTMKSPTLDQLRTLGPDRVWVTQSDESVVLLYEPRVVRDTLVGYIGMRRAKLPGAGIQRLRVRASAPTRTILLAGGLIVGFGGVLFAVSGSGPSRVQGPLPGGSGDCIEFPEQPGCNGN